MIDGLRSWLMGVIMLSVVCAGADTLMPQGSTRRVGRLVCAMALLCVMLRPLEGLTGTDLRRSIREYGAEIGQLREELERETARTQKSVIEEHCAAYIADKAAQIGVICRVEVECAVNEEGIWLPKEVDLWGDFSDVERSRMTEFLERQLGIAVQEQNYFIPGEAET